MVKQHSDKRHLAHLPPLVDSPIVFLSTTTWQRRAVLDNATAHRILRGIWERSAEHDGWFVGDYILMPDHVHLFVRSARIADKLMDWVKMWKSVSSRQLVDTMELDHCIWQADYFDRYLRSSESYSEKWMYIEQNPVRKGLVDHPDKWPFKGKIFTLQY